MRCLIDRRARCRAARAVLILACAVGAPAILQGQHPVTVTPDRLTAARELVRAYHERGLFDGIAVVAQHGEVLLEEGFGSADREWGIGFTPDTRFPLASITKQFTAFAVMLLVQEGKVRLGEPIASYLPKLRRDIAEHVTVEQLLQHTSCLPEGTAFLVRERANLPVDPERLFELINAQAPAVPAGCRYSYNNINYVLLARIIEHVSGVEYPTFLRTRLFDPLDMDDTGFGTQSEIVPRRVEGYDVILGAPSRPVYVDASWYRGAGGVFSTARDLVTWDAALRESRLLSPELTARLYQRSPLAAYGFGWSLDTYYEQGDRRTIARHTGGGPGVRTSIDRFLEDEILLVLLSNTGHAQVDELSRRVGIILLGAPAPAAPGRPVDDDLVDALRRAGVDAAVRFYLTAREDSALRVPSSGSLNRIAYQLLRSGHVSEALGMFRLTTRLFPGLSNAYDSFAEGFLVAGNRDSAVVYYQRAVDLDLVAVNALSMLTHLGVTSPARLSDPTLRSILDEGVETALARFRPGTAADSAWEEAYIVAAGYNLLRHARAADAQPLFQFTTTAFPRSSAAWNGLGAVSATLGQTDQAIRCYQRTLELSPEDRTARTMLQRLRAARSPDGDGGGDLSRQEEDR